MPTALPPGEKAAFIALVQAAPYPGGASEAERLEDVLNNYEDIPTAIYRQLELFASNNAYLTAAMAVFTDADLQTAKIYNAKTNLVTLTDPILVVNSDVSSYIEITTASPPYYHVLAILGNSNIKKILIDAYAYLNQLYVGPGALVDIVDSSSPPSYIDIMQLDYLKSSPSTVNIALYGSVINRLNIEQGAVFGGISNDDPENPCTIPVTNIAASSTTSGNIQLTWDSPAVQSPPAAYLFINTYYRQRGSNDWILATDSIGYFNGDEGFTFTKLQGGTPYEFQVIVTCTNGGLSAAATVSATTQCC